MGVLIPKKRPQKKFEQLENTDTIISIKIKQIKNLNCFI